MTITVYRADFQISCWHEFCAQCGWLEEKGKEYLLFDQTLKKIQADLYDDGPVTLRCKVCVNLCRNFICEEIEK